MEGSDTDPNESSFSNEMPRTYFDDPDVEQQVQQNDHKNTANTQKQGWCSENWKGMLAIIYLFITLIVIVVLAAKYAELLGAKAELKQEFGSVNISPQNWLECDAFCFSKEGDCNKTYTRSDEQLIGYKCCDLARRNENNELEENASCGKYGTKTIIDWRFGNAPANNNLQKVVNIERYLTNEIHQLLVENGIKVWFKWIAGYDQRHLLPYAHVIPSLQVWGNDHDTYLGDYGLPYSPVENPDEWKNHFEQSKNDLLLVTHTGGYSKHNVIELTHGKDEDQIWFDEEYKELSATLPAVDRSRFGKEIRRKQKISFEKIMGHDKFNRSQKTILIIGTTNWNHNGRGPSNLDLRPASMANWESLRNLNESYNLIFSQHPSDGTNYNNEDRLPGAIVYKGPELDTEDIIEYGGSEGKLVAVITESSGAFFSIVHLIIDQKIPVVFSLRDKEKWEQHKDELMTEDMVVMHFGKDDYAAKVQKAIQDFTNNEIKIQKTAALKNHTQIFSEDSGPFTEYHNFLKILENMECEGCESQQFKDKIQKLRNVLINDLETTFANM